MFFLWKSWRVECVWRHSNQKIHLHWQWLSIFWRNPSLSDQVPQRFWQTAFAAKGDVTGLIRQYLGSCSSWSSLSFAFNLMSVKMERSQGQSRSTTMTAYDSFEQETFWSLKYLQIFFALLPELLISSVTHSGSFQGHCCHSDLAYLMKCSISLLEKTTPRNPTIPVPSRSSPKSSHLMPWEESWISHRALDGAGYREKSLRSLSASILEMWRTCYCSAWRQWMRTKTLALKAGMWKESLRAAGDPHWNGTLGTLSLAQLHRFRASKQKRTAEHSHLDD